MQVNSSGSLSSTDIGSGDSGATPRAPSNTSASNSIPLLVGSSKRDKIFHQLIELGIYDRFSNLAEKYQNLPFLPIPYDHPIAAEMSALLSTEHKVDKGDPHPFLLQKSFHNLLHPQAKVINGTTVFSPSGDYDIHSFGSTLWAILKKNKSYLIDCLVYWLKDEIAEGKVTKETITEWVEQSIQEVDSNQCSSPRSIREMDEDYVVIATALKVNGYLDMQGLMNMSGSLKTDFEALFPAKSEKGIRAFRSIPNQATVIGFRFEDKFVDIAFKAETTTTNLFSIKAIGLSINSCIDQSSSPLMLHTHVFPPAKILLDWLCGLYTPLTNTMSPLSFTRMLYEGNYLSPNGDEGKRVQFFWDEIESDQEGAKKLLLRIGKKPDKINSILAKSCECENISEKERALLAVLFYLIQDQVYHKQVDCLRPSINPQTNWMFLFRICQSFSMQLKERFSSQMAKQLWLWSENQGWIHLDEGCLGYSIKKGILFHEIPFQIVEDLLTIHGELFFPETRTIRHQPQILDLPCGVKVSGDFDGAVDRLKAYLKDHPEKEDYFERLFNQLASPSISTIDEEPSQETKSFLPHLKLFLAMRSPETANLSECLELVPQIISKKPAQLNALNALHATILSRFDIAGKAAKDPFNPLELNHWIKLAAKSRDGNLIDAAKEIWETHRNDLLLDTDLFLIQGYHYHRPASALSLFKNISENRRAPLSLKQCLASIFFIIRSYQTHKLPIDCDMIYAPLFRTLSSKEFLPFEDEKQISSFQEAVSYCFTHSISPISRAKGGELLFHALINGHLKLEKLRANELELLMPLMSGSMTIPPLSGTCLQIWQEVCIDQGRALLFKDKATSHQILDHLMDQKNLLVKKNQLPFFYFLSLSITSEAIPFNPHFPHWMENLYAQKSPKETPSSMRRVYLEQMLNYTLSTNDFTLIPLIKNELSHYLQNKKVNSLPLVAVHDLAVWKRFCQAMVPTESLEISQFLFIRDSRDDEELKELIKREVVHLLKKNIGTVTERTTLISSLCQNDLNLWKDVWETLSEQNDRNLIAEFWKVYKLMPQSESPASGECWFKVIENLVKHESLLWEAFDFPPPRILSPEMAEKAGQMLLRNAVGFSQPKPKRSKKPASNPSTKEEAIPALSNEKLEKIFKTTKELKSLELPFFLNLVNLFPPAFMQNHSSDFAALAASAVVNWKGSPSDLSAEQRTASQTVHTLLQGVSSPAVQQLAERYASNRNPDKKRSTDKAASSTKPTRFEMEVQKTISKFAKVPFKGKAFQVELTDMIAWVGKCYQLASLLNDPNIAKSNPNFAEIGRLRKSILESVAAKLLSPDCPVHLDHIFSLMDKLEIDPKQIQEVKLALVTVFFAQYDQTPASLKRVKEKVLSNIKFAINWDIDRFYRTFPKGTKESAVNSPWMVGLEIVNQAYPRHLFDDEENRSTKIKGKQSILKRNQVWGSVAFHLLSPPQSNPPMINFCFDTEGKLSCFEEVIRRLIEIDTPFSLTCAFYKYVAFINNQDIISISDTAQFMSTFTTLLEACLKHHDVVIDGKLLLEVLHNTCFPNAVNKQLLGYTQSPRLKDFLLDLKAKEIEYVCECMDKIVFKSNQKKPSLLLANYTEMFLVMLKDYLLKGGFKNRHENFLKTLDDFTATIRLTDLAALAPLSKEQEGAYVPESTTCLRLFNALLTEEEIVDLGVDEDEARLVKASLKEPQEFIKRSGKNFQETQKLFWKWIDQFYAMNETNNVSAVIDALIFTLFDGINGPLVKCTEPNDVERFEGAIGWLNSHPLSDHQKLYLDALKFDFFALKTVEEDPEGFAKQYESLCDRIHTVYLKLPLLHRTTLMAMLTEKVYCVLRTDSFSRKALYKCIELVLYISQTDDTPNKGKKQLHLLALLEMSLKAKNVMDSSDKTCQQLVNTVITELKSNPEMATRAELCELVFNVPLVSTEELKNTVSDWCSRLPKWMYQNGIQKETREHLETLLHIPFARFDDFTKRQLDNLYNNQLDLLFEQLKKEYSTISDKFIYRILPNEE